MLCLAHRLKDIDIGALWDLYRDALQNNAQELYSNESRGYALLLAEGDFYEYLRSSFFATEGAVYAFWKENNRYLSGLRLEPYRDGLLIEALETDPGHRRMGYGKLLMQAVLVQYAGNTIYSHIHKQNTASLQLHFSCGFHRVSDQAVYIDGSVNDRCYTLAWKD